MDNIILLAATGASPEVIKILTDAYITYNLAMVGIIFGFVAIAGIVIYLIERRN